jgi:hypothetical protein
MRRSSPFSNHNLFLSTRTACLMCQPQTSPKVLKPAAPSLLDAAFAQAIIIPLRVVAPLSWTLLLYTLYKGAPPYSQPTVYSALVLWSFVECCFHIWFMISLKRLQRRHVPPALTPEQRRAMLLKVRDESGDAPFLFLNRYTTPFTVKTCKQSAFSCTPTYSIVAPLAHSPCCLSLPYATSRRWFPGATCLREVGREKLTAWTAWAFFGLPVHEVQASSSTAAAELHSTVQEIIDSVALRGDVMGATGTKEGVQVLRLNLDTVKALHRPLVYYAATAAMECAAAACMYAVGTLHMYHLIFYQQILKPVSMLYGIVN